MIGETISHYKIIEKLGKGGMGEVYKAEDTKLKRTVALKFLPPEVMRDKEAKERFVREAQATSALDHPNICTVHEIDETEDGRTFIAMAYYDGGSLKDKIAHEPLPFDEAMDIALQIAKGLSKAHGAGILHRDIKPANVMLTSDGVAKIVDFGLAKVFGVSTTRTLSTVGTVAYMAPEQVRGEALDQRTDIWAMGVLLYEMLTGRLPFKADNEQAVFYLILNNKHEPATRLRTEVPLELERIVNKCLEKDPGRRYLETEELVTDLSDFKKILDSAVSVETVKYTTKRGIYRPIYKNPKLMTAASVLLIALIAVAYLVFRPAGDFTSYERAFFEARYEKVIDKSRSERALDNVKAHYYYLFSVYRVNIPSFPEDVKREYQLLLEENPDSPEAHFYLGFAYLLSSEWRDERDSSWMLINKAESMGLSSLYLSLAKLQLFRNLQLTDELVEMSNRLAQQYPDHPRVLLLAGDAFRRAAYDKEKASQYFRAILDIYPKDMHACLSLAEIELDNNNLETAKEFLDRANEINSEFFEVIRCFASFYEKEGRFEKAEECLLRAINEFGQDDVYYYRTLADLYLKQDRIEEGLDVVNKALEKFRQDRSLLFYLQQFKTRDRWIKAEAKREKSQKLIKWHENLEESFEMAKREKKPLLIDFYTTWCYWCRILDEKTYPNPQVQSHLASFIPVKLNAEIEVDVAKKYEVTSFPTLKVIAEDGEELYEIIGYEEPMEFITSLKEGLAAYEQYAGGKSISPEQLTEVSNLNDAKILAESKKNPIMVVVSSKESKWSEKLLSETMEHPSFKSEATEIVYLNVDQANNRALVKEWDVKYFPTVLFLDEKGDLIYRIQGYQPPDVLGEVVKNIKSAYKKGSQYKGGVRWLYDLDEAKAFALLERKDIFVDVTADWCEPCQWLEQYTFTNPPVIEKLNNEFISIRLDDERDKEVLKSLNVIYFPTLIILDPSGKEVFRKSGFQNPTEFQEFLEIDERKRIISIMGPDRYREYYRREGWSRRLSRAGRYRSAIELLEKQLEELPDQWETYLEIANAYLSMKKPKDAITCYLKAYETEAKIDKSFVSRIVNAYLQAQDVEGLKKSLDEAISRKSDNPSALSELYLGYSDLSEILQKRDQALQKARLAVQTKPDHFSSNLQLGRVLYLSDRLAESKKHLNKAMELDSQSPESCFYLGLIAEKEGNISEKESYFRKAKSRSRAAAGQVSWRRIYNNRMNYYLYPGYIELCVQAYHYALMLEPDIVALKNEAAYVFALENKDLDEALDLINSALEKEPDEWFFMDTKALVLYRQGKYEEANELVEGYIKLIPEQDFERNAGLTWFLGKVKLAVGDTESARSYFEISVQAKDQRADQMRWQEEAKKLLSQMEQDN